MGDFCWLTGPGLCGKLSFDVPVVEILLMAVVSGLVTWATIYFSVKSARNETERSLAATQKTALQAAVLAIAQDAQARFEAQEWRATGGSSASIQAEILLQSSGLPGASIATTWATRFRQALVIAKIAPDLAAPESIYTSLWLYQEDGPQDPIVRDLSEWLADPTSKATYFSKQSEVFMLTLTNFYNERLQVDVEAHAGDEPE